ncbi:MAG: homogentisate 1,2-dioxygenase [Micropepsaceae bacterium]
MSKNWISFPKVEGRVSRQAHADLPDGTYEREIGREGFFGPASHMFHKHMPTAWSSFEGPLRPRLYDTNRLGASEGSPFAAKLLLANANTQIRMWHTSGRMRELARNGDGDELLFFHSGEGDIFCDFGRLSFRDGDYVLLPRGTMWRLETKGAASVLLMEATDSAYRLPDRGMLGDHAQFDPAILETPRIDDAFLGQQGEQTWKVLVKKRGQISTITYPYNPLDAVGWKGNSAPVKLNWRDIRPIVSHRYHLPPSVHTTFLADRFVVCTFVPRPIESDPGALKVPFFHSNDDYDEVIFYHAGNFFSRDNIKAGMMSFHPAGFTHGPHPKAFAAGAKFERKETDEVAVMIDTRGALDPTRDAEAIEDSAYVESWRGAK